jgi:hypothetical protein
MDIDNSALDVLLSAIGKGKNHDPKHRHSAYLFKAIEGPPITPIAAHFASRT